MTSIPPLLHLHLSYPIQHHQCIIISADLTLSDPSSLLLDLAWPRTRKIREQNREPKYICLSTAVYRSQSNQSKTKHNLILYIHYHTYPTSCPTSSSPSHTHLTHISHKLCLHPNHTHTQKTQHHNQSHTQHPPSSHTWTPINTKPVPTPKQPPPSRH